MQAAVHIGKFGSVSDRCAAPKPQLLKHVHHRSRLCPVPAKDRKWEDAAVSGIDKFMGTSSSPPAAQPPAKVSRQPSMLGNGVLLLLALNFGIFALDKILHVSWVPNLYFWGAKADWWQYITSSVCHANFHHLSSNMFMLYVFGKTVEEEEGAFGVLFSYFFCALGSAIASRIFMPNAAGLGASGAVFGLFMVSALLKLQWNVRRLVELAAITPFVYDQVTSNVLAQATGGIGNISHVGHLGGAAAGLILVALLSLLPE